MKNKYEDMSYKEMSDMIPKVSYGKEARELHRALKKKYGDGLPLYGRYPDFPIYFSVVALVFSISVLVFVSI